MSEYTLPSRATKFRRHYATEYRSAQRRQDPDRVARQPAGRTELPEQEEQDPSRGR